MLITKSLIFNNLTCSLSIFFFLIFTLNIIHVTTTISSTIENDSNKIFITHSDPSTETDLGAENKTLDELRIENFIEFIVIVQANVEDCYYQSLNRGDILHININVLNDKSMVANFVIYNPFNEKIFHRFKSTHLWYDNNFINIPGDYKVCIMNDSREKLISFNLISYAKNVNIKTKSTVDMEAQQAIFDQSHVYMSTYLKSIDKNIKNLTVSQNRFKKTNYRDEALIKLKLKYFTNRSILFCITIVLCGVIQSYFIKKLFTTTSNSSTKKSNNLPLPNVRQSNDSSSFNYNTNAYHNK